MVTAPSSPVKVTTLTIDPATQGLEVDQTRSSSGPKIALRAITGALSQKPVGISAIKPVSLNIRLLA